MYSQFGISVINYKTSSCRMFGVSVICGNLAANWWDVLVWVWSSFNGVNIGPACVRTCTYILLGCLFALIYIFENFPVCNFPAFGSILIFMVCSMGPCKCFFLFYQMCCVVWVFFDICLMSFLHVCFTYVPYRWACVDCYFLFCRRYPNGFWSAFLFCANVGRCVWTWMVFYFVDFVYSVFCFVLWCNFFIHPIVYPLFCFTICVIVLSSRHVYRLLFSGIFSNLWSMGSYDACLWLLGWLDLLLHP